jgi:hypothetical protein
VAMLEREREEKNIKKIIITARIFGLFFFLFIHDCVLKKKKRLFSHYFKVSTGLPETWSSFGLDHNSEG